MSFLKNEIEWLGLKITKRGIKPLASKTSAKINITPRATLKNLRSFLSSVHHLSNIIQKLALLRYPLRPLQKKSEQFSWTGNHTIHFKEIKAKFFEINKNRLYNQNLESRTKAIRINEA